MAQAKIQSKMTEAQCAKFSRTLSMADRSGRLLETLDQLEMRYGEVPGLSMCGADRAWSWTYTLYTIYSIILYDTDVIVTGWGDEIVVEATTAAAGSVVIIIRFWKFSSFTVSVTWIWDFSALSLYNSSDFCGCGWTSAHVLLSLSGRQGGGFTRSSIGHGAGKGVHPGNAPVHSERTRNA